MKKSLFTLFLFLTVSVLNAQWVAQPFDTSGNAGFWLTETFSNSPNETAFINFSNNDADKVEGAASMQVDYRVEAADGWGGFTVKVHRTDSSNSAQTYYDLSEGNELKLWVKVITPANMSVDGSMNMELKLIEHAPWQSDRDLWFHAVQGIDLLTAGDWVELTLPLERNDDNTLGFGLQFGDGDSELQLEYVIGLELALVYITGGNSADPPTSEGTFLMDNLMLSGSRYEPVVTFDDAAAEGYFDALDWMDWAGDEGKGTIDLSNNTTDKVEGDASLQLDYTVNASQDWGGYVNMTKFFDVPENFAERTRITVFMKSVAGHESVNPDRLTVRFFIIENNTGADENWIAGPPITLSATSEWQRFVLELDEKPIINDAEGNPSLFPEDGFAQAWWEPMGDQVFNPDFIRGIKIELSAAAGEGNPVGETMSGTLLFDIIQQGGFRSADNTAPDAPSNLTIVEGTYTNLVTWADVAGEDGEKYNIYYSDEAFTDITAANVEVLSENVGENVQVYEHVLIAPADDQDVTYYYAINAVDGAMNVGEASFSSAVTNTARGVTTISMTPPANFVADGDLSEWAGMRPFRMFPSDGSATIHTNTTVDGDDDASMNAYVALDLVNKILYTAYEVNDDVIGHNPDPGFASYGNDSPDLFIGLYDWRGAGHGGYQRGSEPDYHLRFNMDLAREDHWDAETDSLLIAGTPDYFWGETLSGYVVEARITFDKLANMRDSEAAVKDTIPELKEGFRIPIDFSLNDNDLNGMAEPWQAREGILFYSTSNQDQGWEKPWSWTYTWIGDLWEPTGVEDDLGANFTYALDQNYPNPFNPTTKIKYSIAKPGTVKMSVYDILGREIAVLVDKQLAAGNHSVTFNTAGLATGIYLYRIESGAFTSVKKMMLVK